MNPEDKARESLDDYAKALAAAYDTGMADERTRIREEVEREIQMLQSFKGTEATITALRWVLNKLEAKAK